MSKADRKHQRSSEVDGAHATKMFKTEGANSNSVSTTKALLRTSVTEGPFSVLHSAMKENIRVFIQCRFNKSLLASVVAFDKHFNLVLQDVIELSGNEKEGQKQRSIRNLFLRGESVIFVVKLP
uniref:Small nuclear ribonucleoprotein Sm D2 n=1 Tax=Lygus hesperus TaxID=30085 RepID=A0A0A9Y623_LYGHE